MLKEIMNFLERLEKEIRVQSRVSIQRKGSDLEIVAWGRVGERLWDYHYVVSAGLFDKGLDLELKYIVGSFSREVNRFFEEKAE